MTARELQKEKIKNIQKERMKSYFIDAAKKIVKEQGVSGLNARKIGEEAGYSYATIYNYFDDMNHLMVAAAYSFLEECYLELLSVTDHSKNALEQLIIYTKTYFMYFINNPKAFDLVLLEKLGDKTRDFDGKSSVAHVLRDAIIECVREGYLKEEDAEKAQRIISYYTNGKLVFCIGERDDLSSEDALNAIDKEIRYIMRQC